MKRKDFIQQSLLAGLGIVAGTGKLFATPEAPGNNQPFNMKFSPDFGLFAEAAGKDPVDQIKWGYDHGFRAWESTFLRRMETSEHERISQALQRLGMEFGQFVGTMSFTEVTFAGRNEELREQTLKEVRESVEIAKRMNTKFIHNVLGKADPNLPWDFQLANAIELLKRVAEIYEPHGITMVMETMNHKINHPGMFLHRTPQGYAMAKAVDSPAVKLLFDVYHVQIQEGNLIPTIDYAWDQIAYFQLGDTPGRKEPGTGEINYANLLKHIHDKGYRGFLGLEHKASQPGEEGGLAVLKAYRSIDPKP